MIDAEVAADADQPGLEIRAAIEGVQRLEDLQEDVLRQILGLVVPAGELVGDVEDLAPVLADDLLPRASDRRPGSADQRIDRISGAGEGSGMSSVDSEDPEPSADPESYHSDQHCRASGLRPRHLRRGRLAGRRRLADIAPPSGTPCYVYDAAAIRAAYATLDAAFDGYPHAIHYALKANSALAIVRLLHALGSHADANSLGEVDVALRCGFRPDQIVFTGVGKSAAEIDRAVSLGLLAINVESPGELDRIDQRAIAQDAMARVALRVNPDIDAKSHPHISTGLKSNKFGVPIDEAPALFREMASRRGLHAGRRARAHRLADHHARSAEQGRRSRRGAGARSAQRRHSNCSISTWAAASASRTTAARSSIRRTTFARWSPPRAAAA